MPATKRLKHEPTSRTTATTTRRRRPLKGRAIEAQGRKTKELLITRSDSRRRAPLPSRSGEDAGSGREGAEEEAAEEPRKLSLP
jgi:hypothetical protein